MFTVPPLVYSSQKIVLACAGTTTSSGPAVTALAELPSEIAKRSDAARLVSVGAALVE